MAIALHYSFRKIDHNFMSEEEFIDEELVEQLYLKCCDLKSIPQWTLRLGNLTHLTISNNFIIELPAAISLLSNLNYLDVSNNSLATISSDFFKLNKLQYIDFSGNFLQIIPKGKT